MKHMIYYIGEIFVDKKFIYFYCFHDSLTNIGDMDFIESRFNDRSELKLYGCIYYDKNHPENIPNLLLQNIPEDKPGMCMSILGVNYTPENLKLLEGMSTNPLFNRFKGLDQESLDSIEGKENMAGFVLSLMKEESLSRILETNTSGGFDYEFSLDNENLNTLYICNYLIDAIDGIGELSPMWEECPKIGLAEILTVIEALTDGSITIKSRDGGVDFLYGRKGNILGLVPTRTMFPVEFLDEGDPMGVYYPKGTLKEFRNEEAYPGVDMIIRSVPSKFIADILSIFDYEKGDFIVLSGKIRNSVDFFNKTLDEYRRAGANIESLYSSEDYYIIKLYFKGLRINECRFYWEDLNEADENLNNLLNGLDYIEDTMDALQVKVFDKSQPTGIRALAFYYSLVSSSLFEVKKNTDLIKLIESITKIENKPKMKKRSITLNYQRKVMRDFENKAYGNILDSFWKQEMPIIRCINLITRLFCNK